MAKADFLKSLQDGSSPKEQRLIAARGLAPLSPEETITLLISLTKDRDSEVASQAALTLKSSPEDEILSLVQAKECDVRVLEYFAAAGTSSPILEAIVLNP